MDAIDINNENIESFLSEDKKPVIIDFTASWSLACIMFRDKLEITREKLEKDVIFGTVDIDFAPEIAERFSVITIPTTLIFHKGEIVKQYMGIQEPEVFEDAIKSILGKKKK